MDKKAPKILQFICSTGFYGAERWILALFRNSDPDKSQHSLAITLEQNSQDLELVKQFREQGGTAFEVPMKGRFDLGVVNKLVTLIKENDIDIIHTHGYKSDIIGILAAKKAKIPVVVTPHGFENSNDLKLSLFIKLGNFAMRFADKIVPLSKQLVEDVTAFGVAPKKIEYIQNGVDLSEVEAFRDAPAKLIKEKKRIGFIGQMISRKVIDDILWVFDEISAQRDDVELILLGDGDERERLEALAKTLKSADNISFLGYRNDRLDYLRSFDLFVMTSSLEGIPRCLMEACAMGIPTVAYNIPGVDQLIKHEYNGLLAKFGDKAELKDYWTRLLDNSELADKYGNAGIEYVNKHYSAKRMAQEYERLFNNLL
ncbi:glycosyltransferase [Glaciecola sp. 1036]|uniref:glycosyltransferase n=1 Tax=Alteromonadaceae TaxID=72275 RepID=UPI003D024E1C